MQHSRFQCQCNQQAVSNNASQKQHLVPDWQAIQQLQAAALAFSLMLQLLHP
jgi:hypothetical protein